jgi:phosphoribosyl 1,2-cyclic phosphodiesterase
MRYGGNTTCLQVAIPESDELLIFDAGTGFRNLGNELDGNGAPNKGRIFITHPHWDHLQGFPFFKPFFNSDNWFRLYMPPQPGIGCKEILQGHMSSTFFPVSIDMLQADIQCESINGDKRDFGNYSVEYMWATHTVPTAIFKLEIGNKHIVFAPDNEIFPDRTPKIEAFKKEFRKFVKGADILIHDGQYTAEQYKQRVGWGHSSWNEVLELVKDEQIKEMYLMHHDPDNDDDMLDEIEKQVKTEYGSYFDNVSLAREGQEIIL